MKNPIRYIASIASIRPIASTLGLLLSCLLVMWTGGEAMGAEPPNVLIIMADDCTFSELPAYGGKNAKTPHLDKLAAQSLVFNHAYLSEAMCQPCRAELFSGRFPMNNGCAWNHSASRTGIATMPQQLGALGYRVGDCGKDPRQTRVELSVSESGRV